MKKEFVKFIKAQTAWKHHWFATNPPEVIFTGYFAQPSEIPIDSPIVQSLCHSFEAVMDKAPLISGRSGAADIRHMNMYGDTPTVIFGPGRTEQMHANNEWVDLNEYHQAIRILALTMMDWCGVEG